MKYRKIQKEINVNAIQWKGDNLLEVLRFCDKAFIEEDNYTLKLDMPYTIVKVERGDYIVENDVWGYYVYSAECFENKYEQCD